MEDGGGWSSEDGVWCWEEQAVSRREETLAAAARESLRDSMTCYKMMINTNMW
jgi:hypothetical protein